MNVLSKEPILKGLWPLKKEDKNDNEQKEKQGWMFGLVLLLVFFLIPLIKALGSSAVK